MLPKMGGDGPGVGIFACVILLLCAVNNVNSYSKYGRGCQDIGCMPNEECVISQDSCSYTQREGKDCGSYPTCKRKVGASSSSSGPVNPSGTSLKTGFESNIFSPSSASSSSSLSSSSSSLSSNTQTHLNHNGNDYNGIGSSTMNGGGNNNNNKNGNQQNGASNTNKAKNNNGANGNGNGHSNGLAPIDPHYVFGAPYSAPIIPNMPIFPYNAPTLAPSFQQFPQPNHPGSIFNPGLPHGLQPMNPYNPSFAFGQQPFYPAPGGTGGPPGSSGGGLAPFYGTGGFQNPNMYNKPPPQYQNQNQNPSQKTYNRQTQSHHRYSSAARVGGHGDVASVGAVVTLGCIAIVFNTILQKLLSFTHST